MLTESSNPTKAKKPSAVAPRTPVIRAVPVPLASKSVSREASPSPVTTAATPIPMMTSRPVTSTMVSTTFVLTDSATPRTLSAASATMKRIATSVGEMSTNSCR